MAQLNDERRARYRQALDTAETPLRGQNKMNFFKLATGTTKVRILPGIDPSSPDKDFYCKAGTHYWVNPSNPKIPVPCSKTKNPKATCVICDKVAELKASSNKADNVEAEKLRARVRYYVGLIPRETDAAGKVHVYPAPKGIYTKILSLMEDPEYGDITNPTEGFDLNITRSGSGMETKYDGYPARNPTPISNDPEEVAAVLAAQPELWRFREAPAQEEIQKFMEGSLDRFTTGGFAVKALVGKAEIAEPTDTYPSEEEQNSPAVEPESKSEPEPEVETSTPAKKTKKFSNIDSVREMLSK
jgi:hypothetical protein